MSKLQYINLWYLYDFVVGEIGEFRTETLQLTTLDLFLASEALSRLVNPRPFKLNLSPLA